MRVPGSPPPSELLTSREAARRLSVSLSTFWRLVAEGVLPAPLRFSARVVRWRAVDIQRFIESLSPAQRP